MIEKLKKVEDMLNKARARLWLDDWDDLDVRCDDAGELIEDAIILLGLEIKGRKFARG